MTGTGDDRIGSATVEAIRNYLKSEWRPFATAPTDGRLVLLYASDIHLIWLGPARVVHWKQKKGIPTHWMPLPAPPILEKGEQSTDRSEQEVAKS